MQLHDFVLHNSVQACMRRRFQLAVVCPFLFPPVLFCHDVPLLRVYCTLPCFCAGFLAPLYCSVMYYKNNSVPSLHVPRSPHLLFCLSTCLLPLLSILPPPAIISALLIFVACFSCYLFVLSRVLSLSCLSTCFLLHLL